EHGCEVFVHGGPLHGPGMNKRKTRRGGGLVRAYFTAPPRHSCAVIPVPSRSFPRRRESMATCRFRLDSRLRGNDKNIYGNDKSIYGNDKNI
ncbi:MAG TPA: hypothetical protein VN617_11365, partial [Rhodoferax sp.]|nr:hypothetical protein [Rhodoferax sp.]